MLTRWACVVGEEKQGIVVGVASQERRWGVKAEERQLDPFTAVAGRLSQDLSFLRPLSPWWLGRCGFGVADNDAFALRGVKSTWLGKAGERRAEVMKEWELERMRGVKV